MKLLKLFLVITFLTAINCNRDKKNINGKRIEIENEYNIKKEIIPSEEYENQKLNPETFFKISIEINKLTQKYNKLISTVSNDKINSLLNELDLKIKKVYESFNTTESEFNNYSMKHYKELDEYLKKHPEIDKKLRNNY